jgi:hypothetical protein
MNALTMRLPMIVTLLLFAAMLLHGPVAQLPHYHEFADARTLFGLPNAMDVMSNLGFGLVGVWGLVKLWPHRAGPQLTAGWPGYLLFLVALVLTAIGSAYYHSAPDNARLVWDRIPIVLACAGLMAAVIGETGQASRVPAWTLALAAAGILSVVWWRMTDLAGQGDLRFYLLLQVLSLILIPLWQWLQPAPRDTRLAFGAAVLLYVCAKAAELGDHAFFAASGWLSGHTLKHVLATLAAWVLVRHLIRRMFCKSGSNLRN